MLEHIKDDAAALRCFRDILVPGGRLVLLVPACPSLYSKIDAGLDHYRRYSRAELGSKLEVAGFRVEHAGFLNLPGALGWFMNGRILRRNMLPKYQLKLFDLFVPLLKIERRLKIPFGLSLLAVGRKD